LNKKNSIELGNLSPTRDLTYVTDTCNAFLAIYGSDSLLGRVTNVGMNKEISIGDLGRLIAKLMKQEINFLLKDERVRPPKSEVERLICDNSKLLKYTNWESQYSLEEGIREVIKWMKDPENLGIYKSGQYNV
jgi:dTDP-glucose 4,6-dehydratase